MESQQLVDYIRQQLATGYTEANLRPYLIQYGWSQQAVDAAFESYYAQRVDAGKAVDSKKKSRTVRSHIKRVKAGKWTWQRALKFGIGFAVIALAIGGYTFVNNMRKEKPGPPPKIVLTYPQKQSSDVSLVGGAVAQFAATYGDLPAHVQPTGDGGLAFCGAQCSASELTLGSPQVYQAPNIKLVGYESNLSAPDQNTMYLVPAAKCSTSTKLGGPNTSPRSIVILYARQEGSSLLQRCVTL